MPSKRNEGRKTPIYGTFWHYFLHIQRHHSTAKKISQIQNKLVHLWLCSYIAAKFEGVVQKLMEIGWQVWVGGVCKFSDFRAITRYNYGPLRSVRLISSKYRTPFENARDRATIRLGIASLIANILVVLLFACCYFFRYTIIQPTALQHGSYMCNQVLDTVTWKYA